MPSSSDTTGARSRPRISTGRANSERIPLGVGQRQGLGDELPEDGRDDGHGERHDDACDDAARRRCAEDAAPASPPAPGRCSGPANAAARKPTKVMTSWSTARKRPGWLMSRSTRRARLSPSSMSCWSRLRRTVTSAISAATNTPLSEDEHPDDEQLDERRPSAVPGVAVVRRLPAGSRMRGRHAHAPWCAAGTSWVTTEPAPVTRALADGHRRPQDGVRADERAVADDRPVLARGRRSWR